RSISLNIKTDAAGLIEECSSMPLFDASDSKCTEPVTACNDGSPWVPFTQTIIFPQTKNCAWNVGDNLGKKNGRQQAKTEQEVFLNIPAGAVLCDASITTPAQTLKYDDEFFLLLGDSIITTRQNVPQFFDSLNGIYQWDWLKYRGVKQQEYRGSDGKKTTFCLASPDPLEVNTCRLPTTQNKGSASLVIGPKTLNNIAANLLDKSAVQSFRTIVTGDNNGGDCYHTQLTFTIQGQYAQ
ncbi:MAG: hypothetical protein KDD33_11505, partial [Bdellovibrionales bacterium]|nr:hypothetical protein [Bdellovibrionales bacterium]